METEAVALWGEPVAVLIEGGHKYLPKSEQIEQQLKEEQLKKQAWVYHCHRFEMKEGKCVSVSEIEKQ